MQYFVGIVPPDEIYEKIVLIPGLKIFEAAETGPAKVDSFHPHLTLGRSWCGFTPADFDRMKILIQAYLAGGGIRFEAQALRIYYKPDPHARYQTYKDVPFRDKVLS